MDFNFVVLAGQLATDPEIREFESGSRLARYLLTVRSDDIHKRVDLVPVTRWNPSADESARVRGDRVWVTGTVQRRFSSTENERRSRVEIVATHLQVRGTEDELLA